VCSSCVRGECARRHAAERDSLLDFETPVPRTLRALPREMPLTHSRRVVEWYLSGERYLYLPIHLFRVLFVGALSLISLVRGICVVSRYICRHPYLSPSRHCSLSSLLSVVTAISLPPSLATGPSEHQLASCNNMCRPSAAHIAARGNVSAHVTSAPGPPAPNVNKQLFSSALLPRNRLTNVTKYGPTLPRLGLHILHSTHLLT